MGGRKLCIRISTHEIRWDIRENVVVANDVDFFVFCVVTRGMKR